MSNWACLINGEPGECIDVSDRGLAYGDGLFETIAVSRGKPCLWQAHLARLSCGLKRLNFPPVDLDQILTETQRVIGYQATGVLKIMLTRGKAQRGYRPEKSQTVTRIVRFNAITLPESKMEQGVSLRVCATRLAANPQLAGIKHLNRLEQVLAQAEWDDSTIDEGLMLDYFDRPVCGTKSNLIVRKNGRFLTPKLDQNGIHGVVRGLFFSQAATLAVEMLETHLTLVDLNQADALYLTNSLIGVWPVREIPELGLAWSAEAWRDALVDAVVRKARATC